jgi:sigma-B regulation protein RsbU (phosphoserine phosphatase)
MAAMSPVHLGTIITLGYLPFLACRPILMKKMISTVEPFYQPRRTFILDLSLSIGAAVLINTYNFLELGFPVTSLVALLIGCVTAGFFIGLEASLDQERTVISEAMQRAGETALPNRFFPMTRKFTLIAVTTSIFVAFVLILIFTRDISWLSKTPQNPESIAKAQLSVTYEIIFIMIILMILIVNLIFSYSKNLKLLFNNQTRVLEKVSTGDLSTKVPVATHDEFGVIAGHTNSMIDGLRHRFELVASLQLAKEVQQNLLPSKSPYLKHFDISGSSSYCEQTGGDYYDYFLLPEDKIGIVVADVCGHGVGAAMLMTSVRAFLISAIAGYTTPDRLLAEINRHITRDCAVSGRFTTMFFMEIDQTGKKLRWVRAGHEPPLHYHAKTGTFSKLAGEGLVLGVEESYHYISRETVDLQIGDIILIGTDGIGETQNPAGELFGGKRVKQSLEDNRENSASAIREALVKKVQEFRGPQSQEDDITLVIVKVR